MITAPAATRAPAAPSGLLLDSFWRAAAYCLRPGIIVLSLAPLAIMLALTALLAWLYWGAAVAGMDAWMHGSIFFSWLDTSLRALGAHDPLAVLAPAAVILLAAPVMVLVALLLAAVLVAPVVLRLVAARRFPDLQRRGADSFWRALLWSGGQTVIALVALLISLPFWLIPPLILILPPVIWGWLTYRVMSYDALDAHASAAERRALLQAHRLPLLAIGIACGYLGAAPAVIWASLALFAVGFVVLIPIGIWIYTWVFAFSALWFTHYCLAALQAQRGVQAAAPNASLRRLSHDS